jgi:hypothetical protein
MLETADEAPAGLRAALPVGGISLARHQLGIALALQCERIVCIARALDPTIAQVKQTAEAAGAGFHLISETRPLVGLVTTIDEVFILADGLLAAPDDAVSLLDAGTCVLVQPIETGLPAGFERIDLNHAAAGAMRVPGRLVERLTDLPADCDAASALQRIALQAGVKQVMLPRGLVDSGSWRLVGSETEAQQAEGEWIKARTTLEAGATPTEVAVRFGVRSLGPALLQGGKGGNGLRIGAFVGLLLSLGSAWFGFAALAFLLAGLAWAARRGFELLHDIERRTLRLRDPVVPGQDMFTWTFDAVLIIVVAWNLSGVPQALGFLGRAFPAFMLIVMLRLVPRALDGRWKLWFRDRGMVAIALAVIAIGGLRAEVVGALAACLALLAAAWPRQPARLTQP